MTQSQLAEAIGRCKLARTNTASPIVNGLISKSGNGKNGSEESMIADSGCSFPVISDKIVRKLGIKIKPFKEAINIVDASGNSLALLGCAVLFIQTQLL